MSYFQNIIQKDEEELVREIFEAQKEDPKDGDFVQIIGKDATSIDLNVDENEVKKIKKAEFKKVVRSKVQYAAFQYLNKKKQTHSKVKDLEYKQLETQTYLKSPLFNTESREMLLHKRFGDR